MIHSEKQLVKLRKQKKKGIQQFKLLAVVVAHYNLKGLAGAQKVLLGTRKLTRVHQKLLGLIVVQTFFQRENELTCTKTAHWGLIGLIVVLTVAPT